jgi:hypothetical protein
VDICNLVAIERRTQIRKQAIPKAFLLNLLSEP